MQDLQTKDIRHLDDAEAWLALGNWGEAHDELEKITPEARASVPVLKVRYAVYAAAKQWELAANAARAILQRAPGISFGYVHLATALHELGRTREAREALLLAPGKSRDWTLRYNLACCSAQLGDLRSAQEWLEKAFEIAGSAHALSLAVEDPDLQRFWETIGAI